MTISMKHAEAVLGNQLTFVQSEDGTVYVPLKRLCESLRIDYEGQRSKVRNRRILNAELVSVPGTDGRHRKMLCLPLEAIGNWASTIDLSTMQSDVLEALKGCLEKPDEVFEGAREARKGGATMEKSAEIAEDVYMEEWDDEAPIHPIYKELRKKMASDLNRLLKTIYRLSEVLTKAIMTEGYGEGILDVNSRTERKLIERSLSAWSKLDTIRAISGNPIEYSLYMSLDDLLNELRRYACSTHEALMYVVVDSSICRLLADDLPEQFVFNCRDFFEIIDSLLGGDVGELEIMLGKIVTP